MAPQPKWRDRRGALGVGGYLNPRCARDGKEERVWGLGASRRPEAAIGIPSPLCSPSTRKVVTGGLTAPLTLAPLGVERKGGFGGWGPHKISRRREQSPFLPFPRKAGQRPHIVS